jgi:hypothetical protein
MDTESLLDNNANGLEEVICILRELIMRIDQSGLVGD